MLSVGLQHIQRWPKCVSQSVAFRGVHGEGSDVLEISQQTASPFQEKDRRLNRVNRFWQSDLPGGFDLKDFEGGERGMRSNPSCILGRDKHSCDCAKVLSFAVRRARSAVVNITQVDNRFWSWHACVLPTGFHLTEMEGGVSDVAPERNSVWHVYPECSMAVLGDGTNQVGQDGRDEPWGGFVLRCRLCHFHSPNAFGK